jgi:hypothetical protein
LTTSIASQPSTSLLLLLHTSHFSPFRYLLHQPYPPFSTTPMSLTQWLWFWDNSFTPAVASTRIHFISQNLNSLVYFPGFPTSVMNSEYDSHLDIGRDLIVLLVLRTRTNQTGMK